MNGITEAHIFVWRVYKNVCFGYSILSPMKQQNSTFNSYNLFPDVNLIQNMVNVLSIVIFCVFHHSDLRARVF